MAEQFLHNPDLPFIKENNAGNKLVNNRFVNQEGMIPVGFSQVLRWAFSKNPQRAEKKSDTFRLPVKKDERIFAQHDDAFCWLGHAAFLFRLGGKLLLTDPILFSSTGLKRLSPLPFDVSLLKNIDYILFTHTHRDHFDEKSVRLLLQQNPDVQFLVPLRMSPLLEKLGAKNITEAGWYQHHNHVAGIDIVFLPAHHWNRRWMYDTNRELWGSFHLQTKSSSVYFAGDTAYAGHFKELAQLFPATKHALLPIGAYKPEWMMQRAHTSPHEAVQAFNELGAQVFIPMHYGTFDLSDEPIGEPLRTVRELHRDGKLNGELLAPAVGETILL
ncbi:MAG: Zn-dependent hydrolase [Bacteroidetes bacterium]|nr:MAG: Zn-dependent hydrolase [Bacteroidota bacterium]